MHGNYRNLRGICVRLPLEPFFFHVPTHHHSSGTLMDFNYLNYFAAAQPCNTQCDNENMMAYYEHILLRARTIFGSCSTKNLSTHSTRDVIIHKNLVAIRMRHSNSVN